MISPATIAGIRVKATGLGPDSAPLHSPSPVIRTAPM
jgi:hypothetical protein